MLTHRVVVLGAILTGTIGMFIAAGCGDDGGEDGGTPSNDPGRAVEGCFDCSDTEYCLVISGDTEEFHCAEAACGTACDCIIDDGKSRVEECAVLYSCQEGGASLYCYPE